MYWPWNMALSKKGMVPKKNAVQMRIMMIIPWNWGVPCFFFGQLHIKPTLQYPAFSWHCLDICYESCGDIAQCSSNGMTVTSGWYRQWVDRLESKRYPKSSLPWNKLIRQQDDNFTQKAWWFQKRWYKFQKRWYTPRKLLKKKHVLKFCPLFSMASVHVQRAIQAGSNLGTPVESKSVPG